MDIWGGSRGFVAVLVTVLAGAGGLAACGSAAKPIAAPPRVDQTPGPDEMLVGVWGSAADGSQHVEGVMPDRPAPEIPKPAGWMYRVRVRCTGSGELATQQTGKSGFKNWQRWPCTGKWGFSSQSFPPGSSTDDTRDLGPYTVVIDSVDTITSWDVEGYAFQVVNVYRQSAGPSPT